MEHTIDLMVDLNFWFFFALNNGLKLTDMDLLINCPEEVLQLMLLFSLEITHCVEEKRSAVQCDAVFSLSICFIS